jgi:serine/threonine protein kinase
MTNMDIVTEDITGRFVRTDKKLGNGTMKLVFLARDEEEGVDVAWNELDTTRAAPEVVKKFLNEIAVLEGLEHPNVLKCTAHFTTHGQKLVFITEMMTGGTLKAFIAQSRNHRLKPRVAQKVCRQLVRGLQYLHSRDPPVIHSNLMCENVFIDAHNCDVKLGDFGLSGRFGCVAHRGHRPEFMALEILEPLGLGYSCKGDVYSFGMCVLEMVTGKDPYGECRRDEEEVHRKVLSGQLPLSLDFEALDDHQYHDKLVYAKVKDLVMVCLAPYHARPTSLELDAHPFFTSTIPPDSLSTGSFYQSHSFLSDASVSSPVALTVSPAPDTASQVSGWIAVSHVADGPLTVSQPKVPRNSPKHPVLQRVANGSRRGSGAGGVWPSDGCIRRELSGQSSPGSEDSARSSTASPPFLCSSLMRWSTESFDAAVCDSSLVVEHQDSLEGELDRSPRFPPSRGCRGAAMQPRNVESSTDSVVLTSQLSSDLQRLSEEEHEILECLKRLERDHRERSARRGERIRRMEEDLRRHGLGVPAL